MDILHKLHKGLGIPSSHNPFMGGFSKIRGTIFEGPHNKEYSIEVSFLGVPFLGKLPYRV